MAHMIDQTTGRAAIAYVGDAPWHRLGQKLTAGASIDQWRVEAGLNYTVERTPVMFNAVSSLGPMPSLMADRDVLYRSDSGAALSVVSKDYRVVQPGEVLDFFGRLAEIGGFDLETAGALSDGKRIWALAKVSDGAPVIGHDVVRPYVLLATSYDGSMATIAKFTAVRVVCNNTITMAVGGFNPATGTSTASTESDTEGRAVSSLIRIPHSQKFIADDVRRGLGIVENAWERWLVNTKVLADTGLSDEQADRFVFSLLSHGQRPNADGRVPDVRESRSYKRIMELFNGAAIGADLTGGQNAWSMVNAVTEFVDHERGRSDDTRMSSAWFGAGDGLKSKAYNSLLSAALEVA